MPAAPETLLRALARGTRNAYTTIRGIARAVMGEASAAPADDDAICAYEARITVGFWLVQSLVMVGGFLLLGYGHTSDPFGFPLGLSSWDLLGGILPAVVFPFLLARMVRKRFRRIDIDAPQPPPQGDA